MKALFFVKKEDAVRAKEMEQKLLKTPRRAGLIFAGISVLAATDERPHPIFKIVVGCDRSIDPRTMDAFVRFILLEEISEGIQIEVHTFAGMARD